MTLWYNFGGNNDGIHDGEDFEYDVKYGDVEDYLMNLPNEELVDAFKKAFESLPKDEQLSLLSERGEKNFACPNFLKWIEEEKSWVVTEFIMEDDILALFEDELHDYFEEDAYAQYEDAVSYRTDPYSYNGLNRSDFY